MYSTKRVAALMMTGAAMAGALAVPQAAFAADAEKEVVHAGCTYLYHSNKTYSYTQRETGDCAGHAWLRYKDSVGRTSDWLHRPIIQTAQASGYTFVWTEHKSQSSETPWHHAL